MDRATRVPADLQEFHRQKLTKDRKLRPAQGQKIQLIIQPINMTATSAIKVATTPEDLKSGQGKKLLLGPEAQTTRMTYKKSHPVSSLNGLKVAQSLLHSVSTGPARDHTLMLNSDGNPEESLASGPATTRSKTGAEDTREGVHTMVETRTGAAQLT